MAVTRLPGKVPVDVPAVKPVELPAVVNRLLALLVALKGDSPGGQLCKKKKRKDCEECRSDSFDDHGLINYSL